ncbi:uncharacterized protein LOC129322213 [Prosopis cineraria]|uniref:uncharacterized protein LOC129322213 n=1 Tax=Prosopis cineraria TaxID=364024 RepID=UPI0024107C58|nr:uncharacterized protein LOC129322213 [Prosopis cineraria]
MDLFRTPSSLKSNRLEAALGAARIVFMSMGVITILVLLKVAIIPCAFDFALSTFPRLLVSTRTLLSPVFVYIIVNFIIIIIVASSNFHYKTVTFSDHSPPPDLKRTTTVSAADDVITESDYAIPDVTPVHQSELESQSNDPIEEKKVVLEDSASSCDKSGANRSPEKCANDYVSPDADDTLDATWRAIMEGQGKTKTPQLKKSDTWGARIEKAEPFRENEDGEDDLVAWARKELKKSETFNDTASLRRDISMTPEELNRRADAFIQNFINQMRLQRLESDQRFMEMVNRRA